MGDFVVSGDGAGAISTAELAELLIELERSLSADPPDRVVLADDSDRALAAALVAAKLPVPIEVDVTPTDRPSVNARLIAQLAAAYTPAA
jgi:hypothetical protein